MRRARTCVKLASAIEQLSNVPLSHIGDLTLTFPLSVDLPTIQRTLTALCNNLLYRPMNTRGLRIIGRVGNRYHVHYLIDFSLDLADGFDWTAFQRYQQLHREWLLDRSPVLRRLMLIEERAYRQSMNADLRRLQQTIQAWLLNNNGGRCWLLPVRTSLKACRFYLQSNLPYYRRDNEKGVHWLVCWGLEALKDCNFQPHNQWYTNLRRNLTAFVQRIGLDVDTAADTMKQLYGPRWQWQMRELIGSINQLSPAQLRQLQAIQQNCTLHRLRQQPDGLAATNC